MDSITETLSIELISAILKAVAAPILLLDETRDNSRFDLALNDLKACSLVCRKFIPLCQRCIFHTINLETHDRTRGPVPQSIIGRFADIVETSPIIGSYVRVATLRIAPHPSHTFEVYYHPDKVVPALRSLTNLETIKLVPENPIVWQDIPSSLTSEIHHLFELPTLKNIHIYRVQNFDIRSVAPCIGLGRLVFNTSSLDGDLSEIPSTTVSVTPAQPIRIDIAPGLCQQPTLLSKIMSSKLFDFRRLETFHLISTCMDDVRAASHFLQQVKPPFLKEIHLAFPLEIDILEISALARHGAMKVIEHLAFSFTCPVSGINRHLFGMCLFLQNLSNDNRIKVLTIFVEYLPCTSDHQNDQDWDVVSSILLAPEWSSLTKVDLRITAYTDHENLPQAMTRAAVLKTLPHTRLRGLSSTKSFEFLWSLKTVVRDPRGFEYTADFS